MRSRKRVCGRRRACEEKKSELVQPICYSVAKALTRAYLNGSYEGHRHSLLKLIERSVQVEYLHNLWK